MSRMMCDADVVRAPAPPSERVKRFDLLAFRLAAFSGSVFLNRKEVIQPHLPVRLPCYDFTPLTRHTFGTVPLIQVRPATSGTPNSGGVTGGVYKARERIHRAMPVSYTHLTLPTN